MFGNCLIGPTGYEQVHYEAPPGAEVHRQINAFLQWYNNTTPSVNSDPEIPGLVRAAIAHAWLELIHPFDDGNGRVGLILPSIWSAASHSALRLDELLHV